ncbi:MAG: sn-glycerol-3-phosphate ABC transporter ATP-binding protein UgpC [Maritimibacter sp.]|nr:sn-glycerol-3-phosphate ABC transporter ATP-binding protein UgpC [Maritimibacter sp.]
MTAVQLSGIRKSFGAVDIIHGLDLAIEQGEFVVFVGPSGCGKSTLLRLIAGLETATAGTIRIGDQDVTSVPPAKRGVAMVFQSYALFPHMSVADNISFGLRLAGEPKDVIERKVRNVAETLQLTSLLDRRPKQLSGGQRQRVAIGRAIIRDPKVFLFDEPLSNLDAALRTQMRVELATLHKRLDATMIYVTHDQVEAMTMADRIVVLNEGRIEQVGAPLALYRNPVNHFVASFLGAPRMNFVSGTVTALGAGAIVEVAGLPPVELPLLIEGQGLSAGDSVMLGIRPEHLRIGEGAVSAEGEVRLSEELGRETVLYVDAGALKTTGSDTGTANVTLILGEVAPPADGSRIRFGFDPAEAFLFGADGRTVTAPKSLS